MAIFCVLEFVCLPWSEVCSARVTSLLLLLLLLMAIWAIFLLFVFFWIVDRIADSDPGFADLQVPLHRNSKVFLSCWLLEEVAVAWEVAHISNAKASLRASHTSQTPNQTAPLQDPRPVACTIHTFNPSSCAPPATSTTS